MSSRIYVIGSSNTDMVVRSETLPAPGETVLGGRFIQAHGGKGANQAVAAARAGGDVVFICCIGIDSYGDESVAAYETEGINTQYIKIDQEFHSGIALILVDGNGENLISVASGTNSNLLPDDIEFLDELISANDVVLLQLEIPLATAERVIQIAHRRNAIVILDPAPAPPSGLPKRIYSQLDFILPNQHEAAKLLGHTSSSAPELKEMAQSLRDFGARHTIITAGSEGIVLSTELGTFSFTANQVKAVDSTAAGDAFAGALAASLSEGFKTREAVAWAMRAAELSVTRMGAQPSLPTREEIEQQMNE